MQTIARGSILAGLALATFLAGGCMSTKPAPAKSAFFTSCKDLDALASRAATAADCTLKDKMPASSAESRGGKRLHHHATFLCNVQGGPEATEKFLRALKAEVEKLAKQAGADIIDTTEFTAPAAQGKDLDGRVAGFAISYGIGDAHGKFEANIQQRPDAKDQQVKVNLEEWAG
jgi:hypothetical protein